MLEAAKIRRIFGKPFASCLSTAALVAVLVCVLSILLTYPAITLAQESVGAITGVIHDPSGAVVPNASVTARAVSTGVETKVKSNSAGAYAFPLLNIGEYVVTVQVSGFKALE